eukprot:8305714-Lingulodinium_polyedra.AAC.1
MPCGRQQLAIRAYLLAVKGVARKHSVDSVGRDASLLAVKQLHRRLLRKARQGKGGSTEDTQ